MSDKDEALRLADILQHKLPSIECLEVAAACLRRQHAEIAGLKAECDALRALLSEVASCFTRDDDLPDELLPRIDAAIDAAREWK